MYNNCFQQTDYLGNLKTISLKEAKLLGEKSARNLINILFQNKK